MNFNQLYEREVPFMSKAASPKDGKMCRAYVFESFPFAELKEKTI